MWDKKEVTYSSKIGLLLIAVLSTTVLLTMQQVSAMRAQNISEREMEVV